jgi:hypothetical protein
MVIWSGIITTLRRQAAREPAQEKRRAPRTVPNQPRGPQVRTVAP